MAISTNPAIPKKKKSSEREELLPPSTARPLASVHDTLPPTEDVGRHDTIPAPTWFGDPVSVPERR